MVFPLPCSLTVAVCVLEQSRSPRDTNLLRLVATSVSTTLRLGCSGGSHCEVVSTGCLGLVATLVNAQRECVAN